MAEAMINEKYLQATMPTLPVDDLSSSCAHSRYNEKQSQNVNHINNAFVDTSTDSRNPTNTSFQQRKRTSKVNFELPPSKRSRRNVNDVISGIQTCITSHDRLEAIYEACIKFDHDIQSVHDTEISMGADIALFKHLPLLILKRQGIDSTAAKLEYVSIMEEISNTFTALEMVLRCSADSISTCFARIGVELFPILLEFIQNLLTDFSEASKTNTNIVGSQNSSKLPKGGTPTDQDLHEVDRRSSSSTPSHSSNGSIKRLDPEASTNTTDDPERETSSWKVASMVTIKTCTKIIGHFARVGSLTESLANTPMLLDTLCSVIMSGGSSCNSVPIEAKLNCLWVIANLACSAENMVLMSEHSQIRETLFEILAHPTVDEENDCDDINEFIKLLRTRSVAVRAVMNLSWAQENKIPFAENIDLVENLMRIASHRTSKWAGSGRGVSGILLQSRRHACGTLRNLAAAPRKYKRRLCRFKSGNFLDELADIAKHDHDIEVREKIHATLFNLVSADTAKLFTEKKTVLDVIIAAATIDEKDTNSPKNYKRGSRKTAEETLRSLEKALPEDDVGYDVLRPTLSRFDSQIGINRTNSNLGSVTISITNLGALPSISNFSFGDISTTNL